MPLTFYVDQPDFIEKLNDLWAQVQALGSVSLLQGPQGVPGPRGITGARGVTGLTGTPGTQIYSGSGAPTSGVGVSGDYYVDLYNDDLYGPKAGTLWPTPPIHLGSSVVQREALVALTNGNSSNDLDWSLYGAFSLTVTGTSCALNHLNLPTPLVGSMLGFITNGGNCDVGTLFPGVIWTGDNEPAMETTGFNFVSLWCHDGSTLYGVAA